MLIIFVNACVSHSLDGACHNLFMNKCIGFDMPSRSSETWRFTLSTGLLKDEYFLGTFLSKDGSQVRYFE
jgi:hypothetical protein